MSDQQIILDTNAYLRLGHSIYPLIHKKFGKTATYSLIIHPFLEEEVIKKSGRLNSDSFRLKFYWFFDEKYKKDRKLNISISKKDFKEINSIVKTIRNSEEFRSYQGVSDIDLWCLGFGLHFNIRLVTDDTDMFYLGRELEVEMISTLELLKLMLDEGHISFEKIKEIAHYWQYLPDIPHNFEKEFFRLFGEAVPKSDFGCK